MAHEVGGNVASGSFSRSLRRCISWRGRVRAGCRRLFRVGMGWGGDRDPIGLRI